MRLLISTVRPTGHAVVVRLPDGAALTGHFTDDNSTRDLTDNIAELLLTGALDAVEAAGSGRPDPAESVEVVRVSYSEPREPGQVGAPATFSWVHLPTRTGDDFDPAEILPLIARALAVILTAGVAAEEAAASPEDAFPAVDPGTADVPGTSDVPGSDG
jgi:hypothetical protein